MYHVYMKQTLNFRYSDPSERPYCDFISLQPVPELHITSNASRKKARAHLESAKECSVDLFVSTDLISPWNYP